VQATGTGHAGLVFASGDVNASLETTGIDSLYFGVGAQFDGSVNVDAKDGGTLVLYNAVRGLTGVILDAPAIRLATNVDVEAASLTGTAPDVTFTGTVDATTPGAQSLSVTALGTTIFEEAVGSQAALGSLLTRGIAPLSIPQSADSQTMPLYYMPEYSPKAPGTVKTGIPVAVGTNAPLFYTFDSGGSTFAAGYSQAFWTGVPPVGPGPVSFGYGNGNSLDGVAVTTPITIGTGTKSLTTGPIQFGAGTSGGDPKLKQAYDFSNPNAGPLNGRFFGDFGAGFAQKPVPGQQQQMASALFQLPGSLSSGFLVQLGPIGTQGQVTVGAPQALLDQFHYAVEVAKMAGTPDYPGTNYPALQQFGIGGTYAVNIGGQKYDLDGGKHIETVFDTGGPSTSISNVHDAPPDVKALPPGSTMTASFDNALKPGTKFTWTLTAGQQPSVNVVEFETNPRPHPNVNTGLDLFNAFDVLFDYQHHLVYLRPNGGQSTVVLHSSVHTTGAQSYQQGNVTLNGTYTTQGGAVSVAGTTTLVGDTQITTGSGAVTFSGTIDGAHDAAAAPALTVDTTGATTFVRAVGWVDPLASLTTTGGAATATSSVSTTGPQSYGGDVSLSGPYWVYDKDSAFTVAGATTLAGPVSVNACGAAGAPEWKCADTGASITFNGAVDSLANKGFPLTVVAGATGHVIFNGAVGATNPLGGLAITNADTVTARGTVSLDGGLGYSAAKGLQIGSAGESGYVRVADFTAGGLVLGFQKDGGSNFAVTNGSKGVGCDYEKDSAGACGSGVVVAGGSRLTIQGFAIANNASDGVLLADGTGVTVRGNTIFNNSVDGVFVTGASTNNVISSNTIYGNSRNGVHVSGSGAIGNAILSNSIYSNKDWGIHLIDGGNDGQQPPESVTAQRQEKSITVSGILAGDHNGLFQVQVFGNTVKDQQGAQLLGSGNFAVGAFTITVPEGTWASGTTTHVTVTATPVDGPQNTSEFSTTAQVG
jgi:hypothetical protein